MLIAAFEERQHLIDYRRVVGQTFLKARPSPLLRSFMSVCSDLGNADTIVLRSLSAVRPTTVAMDALRQCQGLNRRWSYSKLRANIQNIQAANMLWVSVLVLVCTVPVTYRS